MEQKDYILREIEKIGQMLMGIMGKLRRKKNRKEYHAGLTIANQEFADETGLSFDMLARMDPASLDAFFANHPELNIPNQELLAELLTDIGNEISDEPEIYFRQALNILERIDRVERTFSMERSGRVEFLKSKMS
jgi:hypothetical protein